MTRLTPDEAQLMLALSVWATGGHHLIVQGSATACRSAVRWAGNMLPMLNRDEAEALARTWHRANNPRETRHRDKPPVVPVRGDGKDAANALLGAADTPGLVHLAHAGTLIVYGIERLQPHVVDDVCSIATEGYDHEKRLPARTLILGTLETASAAGGRLWRHFAVGWTTGTQGPEGAGPTAAEWRGHRLGVERGRRSAEKRPHLPGEAERIRAGAMNLAQVEASLLLMAPRVAQWWRGLEIPAPVRRRRGAVARTLADLAGRLAVHHADFQNARRLGRLPEDLEAGNGAG